MKCTLCVTILCLAAGLSALGHLVCAEIRQGDAVNRIVRFKKAPRDADLGRLPHFTCSDEAYATYLNERLQRHLSIDENGVYWGGGPVLGATDHLWVIEWDCWMLPWVDRAAMGLARQGGSDIDVILTTLSRCTIDKYGYVFGAALSPEPNNSLGGYKPTFGWPWPKYNRNYSTDRPTGWEFNDPNDGALDAWQFSDLEPSGEYRDHRLAARVSGPNPSMTSPHFDCDVFQIPIVEVDIEYRSKDGQDVRRLVDDLRLYWSTDEDAGFSEERSVGVAFSALPPAEYAEDYAEMAGRGFARYPLFFPMYLHPGWGRSGRRITGLRLAPCGGSGRDAEIAVNFVRATYDVRMATTNAALINAAARFYLWNGDEGLLDRMMPRLRRAMLFLNEHLRGKRDRLLCQDWFVGHDGRGGDRPGHGVIGSYWDLLPAGRYDLESNLAYYLALKNMAALERSCKERGLSSSSVSVIGPDNRKVIAYRETAATLRDHAAAVRSAIERRFWNAETGRFARAIDSDGRLHDYGYLHLNLQAIAWGVGAPEQRRSVLSWLDGRPVPGDTSFGADIYRWRFAPRTSTKRNTEGYFWPWIRDWREEPGSPYRVWGDQMQDGGAIPATALWEAIARCGSNDQRQVDRAFERSREVQRWFGDVSAAQGHGREFYRAYYAGHPERGILQSPMPGGIGLDREFLSDSSLGAAVPLYAFLGIETTEDGVLRIAPALPSGLEAIGVQNLYYRGRHLDIEARGASVSLTSRGAQAGPKPRLRVSLVAGPDLERVLLNERPVPCHRRAGRLEALVPLEDGVTRVVAAPAERAGDRSSR